MRKCYKLVSLPSIIVNLKFMGSFQSMVVIFYNIFTFIIAFLFTKAAQDLAWRIVVLFGTEPSVPQANNPHMFLELYP